MARARSVEEAIRLKDEGDRDRRDLNPPETGTGSAAHRTGDGRGPGDPGEGGRAKPLGVAKVLKGMVEAKKPGLVILGNQAIDDEANQAGQMLAALLGGAQGTFASKVELTARRRRLRARSVIRRKLLEFARGMSVLARAMAGD
jgi:electron transfer flavoprotein beta subunit